MTTGTRLAGRRVGITADRRWRAQADVLQQLGADLEAEMQRQVDSYRCEWKETIEDPEKVARFKTFVNADGVFDADQLYVLERGQKRPARPEERSFATPTGVPVTISRRPRKES